MGQKYSGSAAGVMGDRSRPIPVKWNMRCRQVYTASSTAIVSSIDIILLRAELGILMLRNFTGPQFRAPLLGGNLVAETVKMVWQGQGRTAV